MKVFRAAALIVLLLCGCHKAEEDDCCFMGVETMKVDAFGVPLVSDAEPTHDPDGKPMSNRDFLVKYCSGKPDNRICQRVRERLQVESSS